MPEEPKGEIFINYRRGDDPGFARSLFDRLKSIFGEQNVFMDIDALGATNDFATVLAEKVRACSIFLAVIGKNWLDASDDKGRRLGREGDFVTMEIALAFRLNKLVMPILANGAPPLNVDDLPPILRPLASCNAFPLANERYEGDVQKIIREIAKHLGRSDADVARALLHGSSLHNAKPLEIWLTRWDFIKRSTNRKDFTEFLQSNPPADLAGLAWKALENLDWTFVSANLSIKNLEQYLKVHPSREHAAQARSSLEYLHAEARLWAAPATHSSPEALREFIGQFPNGLDKAQAQAELASLEEKLAKEAARRRVVRRSVLKGLAVTPIAAVGIGFARQLWRELLPDPPPDLSARTFTRQQDLIQSVTYSSDGRTLTSVGWGAVKLWDVSSGRELRSFVNLDNGSIAVSPDGSIIARSSGWIKVWDASTGRELRTLCNSGLMAFSPDGRTLATVSIGGLALWDCSTWRELRKSDCPFTPKGLTFLSDGRMVALTYSGKTTEIWDVTGNWRKLFSVEYSASGVVLSPNGLRLLTSGGGPSWEVKLWDVLSRRELYMLEKPQRGFLSSAAFSPDSRTLAASYNIRFPNGSPPSIIKLWDVSNGRDLRTLTGHTDDVKSVAFSPDGRMMASGSDDGTIKLWDVSSGLAAG